MTVASDTRLWGSYAWRFLHAISFTFPEVPTDADKKNYKEFFEMLPAVLPCKICSIHFSQFIQNNPIDTSNREGLSKWVYEAHSNVNKMQNRENPSYETVKEAYTRMPDMAVFTMPEAMQASYMKSEHIEALLSPDNASGSNATLIVSMVIISILVLIIIGLLVKMYLDSRDKPRTKST